MIEVGKCLYFIQFLMSSIMIIIGSVCLNFNQICLFLDDELTFFILGFGTGLMYSSVVSVINFMINEYACLNNSYENLFFIFFQWLTVFILFTLSMTFFKDTIFSNFMIGLIAGICLNIIVYIFIVRLNSN